MQVNQQSKHFSNLKVLVRGGDQMPVQQIKTLHNYIVSTTNHGPHPASWCCYWLLSKQGIDLMWEAIFSFLLVLMT